MTETELRGIQNRIDHAQYMYEHTDEYPTVYESFIYPLAAYESDGKIVRANEKFRRLTGLTQEEITNGASIYDYLNNENKGLISAAKKAFHDREEIMQNLVCPLNPDTKVEKLELNRYKSAVFFPMVYNEENVAISGVYVIPEPIEETDDDV